VLAFMIIGVGVVALVGFGLLLRRPPSESSVEADEDRQGDPPIIDVFSQSGG
jgi:hypothetical protein